MSTLYFTNSEIIVLRTRRIGATDKWTMSATFTAMPATIEPVSPERTEVLNGRPGHLFTAFVSTDHHIKEQDRIITLDETGQRDKQYEVTGVSYWEGAGMLDHQELTLMDEVA